MTINNTTFFVRGLSILSLLATLSGCSSLSEYSVTNKYDMSVKPPLIEKASAKSQQAANKAGSEPVDSDHVPQRFDSSVPPPPEGKLVTSALQVESALELKGEPVTLNIEGLPLPAFIDEVFGNILGLSFHLDPRLQDKQDLVTLRIEAPLPPAELFRTAQGVLSSYGVALQLNDGLVQIQYSPSGASTEAPLIVSGAALPTVPSTHRPVFYLMDLKVVQAQRAVGWLAQAFEGQKATFRSDSERNAVWLQGSLEVVKQAAEVVKLVDQPLMRGRYSMRIEPRFLGADKLTARLVQLMTAQGYNATQGKTGTINFFTIEETDSIIAFVAEPQLLAYVKSWVEELDRPLKRTKGDNVFYYAVKNTSASSIAETINALSSGISAAPTGTKAAAATTSVSRKQLVVDEGRNALLYHGSNEDWVSLLPTIEKLDKPALQVLIEVIVAEVTLSDSFNFGVEWAINNPVSTLFGDILPKSISISEGALNYYPISSSGNTRAILNMLASNNQVNILQTPRILVRSGEEASINVGDEIPILTKNTQSVESSDAPLVQEFQYRKTGNLLTVNPIVFAGGQIDLKISQELSNSDGAGSSPTISTRSIATALTIHDGGSVLVGGLINTSETENEKKVPVLGDIPWLGKALFTTTARSTSRTELMVLIAPYVIGNDRDGKAVTEAFKKRLTLH